MATQNQDRTTHAEPHEAASTADVDVYALALACRAWLDNTSHIFRLEMEQTFTSVFKLAIYRLATVPLAILVWITGALCLAYGVYSISQSLGLSFLTVFLMQVIALMVHMVRMRRVEQQIGFRHTIREFRLLVDTFAAQKEAKHERE